MRDEYLGNIKVKLKSYRKGSPTKEGKKENEKPIIPLTTCMHSAVPGLHILIVASSEPLQIVLPE